MLGAKIHACNMAQTSLCPLIFSSRCPDSLEKAIVKHLKSGPGPGYQGPYFSEAAGCKPGTLMERESIIQKPVARGVL